MGIPLFEPMREGSNSNDFGHLFIGDQAFEEAEEICANGIYLYRAGDGGDCAVPGFNDDVDDE